MITFPANKMTGSGRIAQNINALRAAVVSLAPSSSSGTLTMRTTKGTIRKGTARSVPVEGGGGPAVWA
jgi:hypothetical protein